MDLQRPHREVNFEDASTVLALYLCRVIVNQIIPIAQSVKYYFKYKKIDFQRMHFCWCVIIYLFLYMLLQGRRRWGGWGGSNRPILDADKLLTM